MRASPIHTAVALGTHVVVFWGGAWFVSAPPDRALSWVLSYAAGAVFLTAARWQNKLCLTLRQSTQLLFYASIVAIWFWGANLALDTLGNSVKATRLPPEQREGLPLHLLLVPGVVSVALGALAAAALDRKDTGKRVA